MSHPAVHLVTDGASRAAHMAVHPEFYELDVADQRSAWDEVHRLAYGDGWVAPEDDDLVVVDDDGTERYPFLRLCPLMNRSCSTECRS